MKPKPDQQIENFIRRSKSKNRLEKDIQADIVDWLEENLPGPKMIRKIHGNMYQRAGFPDLEIFWKSMVWCIEIKRKGKDTTPLQKNTIAHLRRIGIHAWVADSVESVQLNMGSHISNAGFCPTYPRTWECSGLMWEKDCDL